MLIDFSAPAYGRAATPPPATPAPAQQPPATVPRPAAMPTATTDLLDAPADWDWKQLRAYAMRSIAERHGPQPSGDEIKIAAIFQSFHKRWGSLAGPIARFAFEQQDGVWRSAPVTVTRFTKGNDAYFAEPIAARLSS